MSIRIGWLALASFAVVSVGTAQAQINGIVDHLRSFNDFSTTTLQHGHGGSVNQGPGNSQETTLETQWADDGMGGTFANRHRFTLSSDNGATDHLFTIDDSYTVKMLVTLEAASDSPRKEAGFLLQPTCCEDVHFIVTSDGGNDVGPGGEIVSFGGPFWSFSDDAFAPNGPGPNPDYIPGTTILMGYTMLSNGAAPNTTEWFIDRLPGLPGGEETSGPLVWGNLEGGPAGDYTISLYSQAEPNLGLEAPPEVVFVDFDDIMFMPIPEPTTMLMSFLAMAGLACVRRKSSR